MISNESSRFNRRGYAKHYHISASTVFDCLTRLQHKGLIDKLGSGMYSVTAKGKQILTVKGGSDSSQGVCRVMRGSRDNFSQHAIRFELKIKSQDFFKYALLEGLGDIKIIQMKGWSYKRIHLDGANIGIYPHKVIIYVDEIVSNNLEDSHMQSMNKAIDIAEKLNKAGLICDTLTLDSTHYARMKSILADVLTKRLGRYEYKLNDGSSFWVDFSNDQLEDETDSARLRERVDEFMEDLAVSNSLFSDLDAIITDVDSLKKIAHMILQHDMNMIRFQKNSLKAFTADQKSGGDYFG